METWQTIVSIAGIFIGVLSGLNAILLSGLRSQIDKNSKENREDHQLIFLELGKKQSVEVCNNNIKNCNGNRDKKLAVADKAAEIISADRRKVIEDKIDGLTVSLDNLSICISKFTKGECP